MGPESKSRNSSGNPVRTWHERCEAHPDHEGIVTNAMVQARMQEEIDELRAAVSERGTRWISAQDELPEDDQIVVACRKDRGSEIVYGEVFKRNLEHVGTWAMTHWFALPSLPSERSGS